MYAFSKTGFGLAAAGLALALTAPAASAKPFELVYTGTFSKADALNPSWAALDPFTGTTPFLVTAFFDDSSPNLAAPVGIPGFVAYSPTSATLTIGRDTFDFTTAAQDLVHGVSVAVFDDTTPFGPTHYAVGLLQNPLADGAGFVGDWLTSSPTFSATHLVPTTFTGYVGVGYGSGPDPHNGNRPAVVPIPLTGPGGTSYLLTLGNYDEEAAGGGAEHRSAPRRRPRSLDDGLVRPPAGPGPGRRGDCRQTQKTERVRGRAPHQDPALKGRVSSWAE